MTQDTVQEALIDLADALEAAAVKLKHTLESQNQDPQKGEIETWDDSKIKWQDREGSKGPIQVSEDFDNLEFKKMLKLLESAGGKLNRKVNNERWFYWVYQNGATVGRKKMQAKQ